MGNSPERVLQGLQEAIGHIKGENVSGLVIHALRKVDVTAALHRVEISYVEGVDNCSEKTYLYDFFSSSEEFNVK